MNIPSIQDIAKLIKAGATLELQEKIVDLRQAMIEVQEQNIALRHEVEALKKQLAELSQSSLPNCPRCGNPAFSLQESKKDRHMGVVGMFRRLYVCRECKFSEDRLEPGE